MSTYPLPTLAATISAAGIYAPPYSDILGSLQASFQLIYGSDVYLQPDSQDGQLLAIFAQAIYDANATAVAVYNSFSPATAQATALSSAVKINGLAREVPSNSQVVVLIGGTVGTTINNGVVGDTGGNSWNLPVVVVIPPSGSISVTATCSVTGAISAPAGTVTLINTPVLGWSTVTNAAAASPGAPVETDAALRIRQAESVALPALTPIEATVAAVAALPGVLQVAYDENPTGAVDANGVPAHSICLIVEGGSATAIAQAIAAKKTPGCGTYGSTSISVVDSNGVPSTINFYVPTQNTITVSVSIHALAGYVSSTAALIQNAISNYINALTIGADVLLTRLYLPAQLFGAAASAQYELMSIQIAISPGVPASSDLIIAFNAMAICAPANVTVNLV